MPTNKEERALDLLRKSSALDPHALGIRHHVEFPNGAVLLRCSSPEQVNVLRTLIPAVPGTEFREQRVRTPELYIHNIPETSTADQIRAAVARALGEEPLDLKILPYSKPVHPNTVFAVCSVTAEQYELAKKRRSIRVGWSACSLRTTPHVPRCNRCHLLGHKDSKCLQPTPAEGMELAGEESTVPTDTINSTSKTPCLDCSAYNDQLKAAKLPRRRYRPTNHATDSATCPSRIAWIRRMLPTTRTAATPAVQPNPSEDSQSRASASNDGSTA